MKINSEEILKSYLPKEKTLLSDAMAYSLLGGGKRLRFNFIAQLAEHFNVWDDNTQRLAAAVEMIHAYSLIHDDLPCMDDDDFRRGKPSCHKAFGYANALLAGDALLNLAAATLFRGKASRRYLAASALLFDCSGEQGMVLGQVYDLQNIPDKEQINRLKTAKLFEGCCLSVGLYANVSKKTYALLYDLGVNYGMAFQLADDASDGIKTDSFEEKLSIYYKKCQDCLQKLDIKGDFFPYALSLLC